MIQKAFTKELILYQSSLFAMSPKSVIFIVDQNTNEVFHSQEEYFLQKQLDLNINDGSNSWSFLMR